MACYLSSYIALSKTNKQTNKQKPLNNKMFFGISKSLDTHHYLDIVIKIFSGA